MVIDNLLLIKVLYNKIIDNIILNRMFNKVSIIFGANESIKGGIGIER